MGSKGYSDQSGQWRLGEVEAVADKGGEEGVEEEEGGKDQVDEVSGGWFEVFADP